MTRTKPSNLQYLTEHSTFNNKHELNEATAEHIHCNPYDLNETDRDIFIMISRYSVKYNGSSHLKTTTIAKAIHKSKRTVQRSISKLVSLYMIERSEFICSKTGGNGANIYIILPCDVIAEMSHREGVGKATETKVEGGEVTNEPIYSISNISSNTLLETTTGDNTPGTDVNNTESNTTTARTSQTADTIIKRGLRHSIPTEIYEALEPFYNGQEMYNTYGILLRSKAKVNGSITLEENHSSYVDAFYNVIRKYKLGEVTSLEGLLYHVWQDVTAELSRKLSDSRIGRSLRVFEELMNGGGSEGVTA